MDGAFRAGKLLLPTEPSAAVAGAGPTPVVATVLIILSVLLGLLFLRNVLNVSPYLLDNFTRARGSAALEGSVRVSRDRNIVALILIIPFILLVLVGHTLNIAMCALGAFVHPLRLNFLEFFKNSGYEATGRKFNPLTK